MESEDNSTRAASLATFSTRGQEVYDRWDQVEAHASLLGTMSPPDCIAGHRNCGMMQHEQYQFVWKAKTCGLEAEEILWERAEWAAS